jgi:hypothetical protein
VTAPAGRFHLAFNQPSLTWAPDWTRIDSTPNLVASYQIDRGRQYELDRTDTGRATVQITDTDGVLDPSNIHGPFYGWIEPLGQALICRQDPVLGTWHERFRGFVEDFNYGWDPSQKVTRLELTLVDIFEILSAVEMFPGDTSHPGFGYTPGAGPDGPLPGEPVLADVGGDQIYFPPVRADRRISRDLLPQALGAAAADFTVVFQMNVNAKWQIYSPGESVMSAVQEAADSEFPGVSNVYTDRYGRLAVHGRLAKFDPVGVHAGAAAGAWDWHRWKIGDGTAVSFSPSDTVHVRSFATSLGLSKVINQAVATPKRTSDPLTNAELAGQYVYDSSGSLTRFGIRSWSANDLLTDYGLLHGDGDLAETRRFAEYYVSNYAWPRMRITDCGFRSMLPGNTGSAELWRFLSLVDISDEITSVSIRAPGGGAFTDEPYYVEGVHETVQPLAPGDLVGFDDVTLTLDLSPAAYFTDDPFT